MQKLNKDDLILVKKHVKKWLSEQQGYYIDHADVDQYVKSLVVKIKGFFDLDVSFPDLREFLKGIIEEGRAHEISL